MANEQPRKATAAEIQRAADVILDSSYPIALTGAGMSVESGIPPFRGPGGLWTKYGEPPMNQFQRFMADPKKAWEERLSSRNDEFYKPLTEARPNPGHIALAELEELGLLRFVITQNVDVRAALPARTDRLERAAAPLSGVRWRPQVRHGVLRRADSR